MTLVLSAILLSCTDAPTPEQPVTPAADDGRPNFLVFTLDTTRADVIGAYGTSPATPNIDALASAGVRFDRAYTVTPLTIPAHSSLFTGLLPPRHGVRDNGDFFLGPEAVTLAETLKEAGYATMAAVGAEVTSHHWGFAQGFDAFYDELGERTQNRWRVERPGNEVVADALSWLGNAPDQPWLAWVHMFDAHHPYAAPEEWNNAYPGKPYLAEVAFLDHLVGEVISSLEASGELANTWVIVLADHGEGLGAHGEAMHGVLLYDPTMRIPLIVRPPGGTTAKVVDAPTSIVDVAPTLAKLAGTEMPDDLDGIDLAPWIEGTASEGLDRPVYLESLYANRHYGWAPQYGLVDDTHKLISSTTPELYAAEDRLEQKDLAPTMGDRLVEMETRLQNLRSTMTPAQGVSEQAQLSSDRMQQLEALGYVTGVASEVTESTEGLPDPKDRLPFLREMENVRQAIQEGDFEKARKRAEAALAEEPGLVDLQLTYAQILLHDKDLEGALAVLEPLEDSGSAQALTMLGTIALHTGSPEVALARLKQATDTDPYFVGAWIPYLHALFMTGDLETFFPEAERARGMFPDDPMVLGMYGMALSMQGEMERARDALERALAANPLQPFANHGLGVVHKHEGDAAQAESYFLEEIRLHPPGLPARRALVELYAAQGRYDEQLEQLDVIAETEPPNLLTVHSRAQALFNLQQFEASYTEIEKCREMSPDYPPCAMLEANALKKLGREAEAQEAFDIAVELAKNYDPAVEGVDRSKEAAASEDPDGAGPPEPRDKP